MYFQFLPKLMYDPVGNGNSRLVTNIMKRAAFRANMKKETVLFTHNLDSEHERT